MAMAMPFVGNDEFWRECAAWLTNLELLRSDHRANWATAVIADLANTLRDGVLLCNLLNKLDPGCIEPKDFSQKPAMAQFLCLRNIRSFLRTCHTHFGLKESDLFEESMLFDLTNFHQVLCTLSKLSTTPKALKSNINGFSAQIEKTEEEEKIYQSLKSVKPQPVVHDRINEFYEFDGFHQGEDIYQDLCVLRSRLPGIQPALEKRDFVIRELIDTERNYIDVLFKIKSYYIIPLERLMEREHHLQIFAHIVDIYDIHVGFKNELLKMQIDKTVHLSDIIMNWREKFLIYGDFCANLTEATILLQDLCDKNDKLNQTISKYDNEANNGRFKLRDLLQVPMQRILRYHLLLEKLVDSTDPNHDEYKELKRAREAMLDVASYINEMARDKDHMNVLKEIGKNMVWDNNQFSMESCGRLRKDGEIKVKEHGDNKGKTRYAFIFDKYMFLTKQGKGNQFLFRTKLDLSNFRVEDTSTRPLLNHNLKWSYQWHMVQFDQSVVYTMSVRSIEIKDMMIKAIRDAIDNIRPFALQKTDHKFEMHQFKAPTTCNRCSKYLKGCIYQGYQCKVCHIPIHKDCIGTSGRCGQPPPLPSSPTNLSPELSSLSSKLWFAGEKDRTEASSLLQNRRNGTFLVRIRLQNDIDRYALSLKTGNGVKHMKICCSSDDEEQKYYLSISRYFKSLEDLVSNYEQISLRENFERLEEDAKLEYPYRQIKCEAKRAFNSPDEAHLCFERGETVIILSKDDIREGWAKGLTRTSIGYFPSSYVVEKEEITYDAF